ncbi:MAG: thiamine pyrophosphate-dependent enzyme [Planctomycetia bacterium]|nr:thiamine pyrophosphate-dependent enzyme [Planctomycetia bacterium]
MTDADSSNRIPLLAALEVVARTRREEIVVTTMGSAREWPKLSQHPLDFHYLPSAMGQSPLIALGLAMAMPERRVIAFTGDGSLLMNLGCLVTIAAAAPKNLTVIALDNGRYEVTGGQMTAGAVNAVEFAAVAAASGFAQSHEFDALDYWRQGWDELRSANGPTFITLDVAPVGPDYQLVVPGPMRSRLAAFRAALSGA